ncbi:histone S-adenosyl methyltransferase, putative [Plasmodium ovale]|uniref:Histone S-adenosyl methyltransferase, putative n=1 Tax=Plasmodium ovale TaxID=36330 RepID=A0A1D3UAC2_PLAOA|nr:histone S-adenosyl methyltransferase, putative [Plasmodium ovale]
MKTNHDDNSSVINTLAEKVEKKINDEMEGVTAENVSIEEAARKGVESQSYGGFPGEESGTVDSHQGKISTKNYVEDILGEVSDDNRDVSSGNVGDDEGDDARTRAHAHARGRVGKDDYFYINDAIKRNYPLEYEDNQIYPKVYCYEPKNFEDFKKKIKNENELRHYECYSATMNEFFYKYNENYYDDILKNECFKKFAQELWENRSNIKNETEYHDFCIQLRKKYKVSPSKHQISVALQHHHLHSQSNGKGDDLPEVGHVGENNGSNTSDVSIPSHGLDDTTAEENPRHAAAPAAVASATVHCVDAVARVGSVGEGHECGLAQGKTEKLRTEEGGDIAGGEREDEIVVNPRGKDVKFVRENVNKMIITKEMKKYKDLDKESVNFLQINKRKGVRSNSGVLVVTLITHPHKFSCKYDCHYCPNEPNQPRSYLSTEPAILRANQNNFDVICQFFNRITTLVNNGHVADKIEVLVLGGTWSCYDVEYQNEFITDVYYAANIYPVLKNRRKKLSLQEEQEINEQCNCRIIGLTLETRPDQINKEELLRLRYYGCTRVQLGIQHTDDFILKKVNRQCTLNECIRAIFLLKENGFKVDIHLMPDLPYSTVQKDIDMFKYVLTSLDLQADQWKIYPCEITPFTKIEKWYNNNEFKPYFETDKNLLISLILLVKKSIHPWIRLNRVIRDIPNPSIIAGNNITNMRQLIANEMNIRNIFCQCIRCKEVKNQEIEKKKDSIFLKIYKYPTLGGEEFFITFQGKKVLKHHIVKGKKSKEKNRREKKTCYNANVEKNLDCLAKGGVDNHHSSCHKDGENGRIGISAFIRSDDAEKNRIYSFSNRVSGYSNDYTPGCNDMVPISREPSPNERWKKGKDLSQDNIFEDYDNAHSLLGFLRLRLRSKNNYCDDRPFKCLEDSALIRELHVYGSLLKHGDFKDELNFIQHKGLGKCLVIVAEIIAYFYNFRKIAIIAGVGTREYYSKLGYVKEESYMTKVLNRMDIYKQYLLNVNKIGKKILIHNYNLNHCLYLMHKEIPEPFKCKRSEIADLNAYINDNIIPLGTQNYLSYKCEYNTSTIDVKKVLQGKWANLFTAFHKHISKLTGFHTTRRSILLNASALLFIGTTMFVSFHFFTKRRNSLIHM